MLGGNIAFAANASMSDAACQHFLPLPPLAHPHHRRGPWSLRRASTVTTANSTSCVRAVFQTISRVGMLRLVPK